MAPRPIAPGLFTSSDDGVRLLASRCSKCACLQFPAADTCPYCGHDACAAHAVGPAGTLFLFTSVASRPPGYRGALPFGFGVVELREGLRVVTRLTEPDPTKLRAGQAMHLVVTPLFTDDDGTPVVSYAFAPDAA